MSYAVQLEAAIDGKKLADVHQPMRCLAMLTGSVAVSAISSSILMFDLSSLLSFLSLSALLPVDDVCAFVSDG